MRLPYDAVIFDLDGTLTESEPGITKSVQYSLDALGRTDYDQALLRTFIGPPLFESYVRTMGMDDATAQKGVALYRERFSKVGWKENSVYMNIPRMLRSLKAQGTYIALASAKPEHFCKRIMTYFGLIQYFDLVIGSDPSDQFSDKPSLVKKALPKSFERACMVGDRYYDIEGGQANNIDTVGVVYGYGSKDELEKAGATHIAETVEELSMILLGDCPQEKGMFISLEGSDGCGKSTQIKPLIEFLTQCGHDVRPTREPGGCPLSERIRNVVLDAEERGMTDLTEALLFAASRAQHVHDVIRPSIDAGKTVLCDRFVDSSIAYQGVGRGLGIDEVWTINRLAVSDTMPNLTVVFDIDPREGLSRRNASSTPDRIEETAQAFIQKTYDYYQQLAKQQPERVRVFDASGTPDEVTENLKLFIAPLL